MAHPIELILHLSGLPAYALVFLLPALESSAFVGFIFPGELAIILGGVLAFQGRVSLGGVLAAAIAGAIIGDSVGYVVGARWGDRILGVRLVRRVVRPERRRQVENLLRRRGATAVFVGRFTAVARVLVPGLSGMAGLPYPRFLAANALGGVLWGGGFTLVGYLAGDAWRRVEHIASRASLLLAILVAMALGVIVVARRIAANERRWRAWLKAIGERPRVAAFRRRYAIQIAFLYRRLDPREALGLYLTIGLALSVAAGWAFGAAAQDILANEALVNADRPLLRFVVHHRSAAFNRLVKSLAVLGTPAVAIVLVAVGALVAARLARSFRPAAFVVICVAGGELLTLVVGSLVARPPPSGGLIAAGAFSFPSGHTVGAVTLLGALAFALSLHVASWRARVWAWAAAFGLVLVVGLCSVYLAVAHPSDVVGGAALGAAWLAFCGTGWRTWERLSRARPGSRWASGPAATSRKSPGGGSTPASRS